MNSALSDELLSINAIYDPDTLSTANETTDTYVLRVPSSEISLRLHFPATYPDQSPVILGPESSGAETRKGEASELVEMARDALTDCFHSGEPCIYDLIEEMMSRLQTLQVLRVEDEQARQQFLAADEPQQDADQSQPQYTISQVEPNWVLSDVATEKKSVFLARAAHAGTLSQAQSYIEHLLTTDRKVARATHNISAWRIRDPVSDVTFQDCDDDGETAAGSRLLHLLQVMNVWNVVVVVSRWYGGVHLGPDRFRLINSVAREALVKGRFEESSKEGKQVARERGKH